MRTDTLRYAAAAIREQNVSGRGFVDDTLLAVADWLIRVAVRDEQGDPIPDWSSAQAVARAYLGGAT